jgi:hypothetical protein
MRIDAEKESVLIRPIGGIRAQKVTVVAFRNWPRAGRVKRSG